VRGERGDNSEARRARRMRFGLEGCCRAGLVVERVWSGTADGCGDGTGLVVGAGWI
jgi:hypothetical protein